MATIENTKSYVAIDDVGLVLMVECKNFDNSFNESTTATANTTPNPQDFFKCFSSKYIPMSKVCDWVKDCEQGEDEIQCGSCDFSARNTCGYKVQSSKWTLSLQYIN